MVSRWHSCAQFQRMAHIYMVLWIKHQQYIWRVLFQITLSRVQRLCFGKELFHVCVCVCVHVCICVCVCVCVCVYVCVYEELSSKTWSNLALALQAHFLKWRLTHFGKEHLIYINSNLIYIVPSGRVYMVTCNMYICIKLYHHKLGISFIYLHNKHKSPHYTLHKWHLAHCCH